MTDKRHVLRTRGICLWGTAVVNTFIPRAAEEGSQLKHPGAGYDSSPQFRGCIIQSVPKTRLSFDQSQSRLLSERAADKLVESLPKGTSIILLIYQESFTKEAEG